METLLKVEGINVYYGAIHAIKDISFQVNQGEIVTLIGANGAGKTTTLQTVSGLLRSKTGSILFDGQDINTVSADKLVGRGLAQVPEGYNLTNVLLSVLYKKSGQPGRFLEITFRPRQGGVNSINLKRIFKIGLRAVGDFHSLRKAVSAAGRARAEEK